MDCYLCGQPAIGECQRCGNPYCGAHGDRLCSRCMAPSGGLASPVLYRSTLVVLILAIASAGWYLYPRPEPSSSPPGEPFSAVASFTAGAQTTVMASATPTSESVPAATATGTSMPSATPTAMATATPSHTPTPVPPIRYEVQWGDTLSDIALKYDTTVEAIIALNGITDPTELQIGQTLLIPLATSGVTPTPTTTPASVIRYEVQWGDTLFDIALKYDTTVEAIIALNGITDPTELQIGQTLLIPLATSGAMPTPTPTPASVIRYEVQRGDTLFNIAQRYGTTAQAIATLNGITDPTTLRIGQVILIPM